MSVRYDIINQELFKINRANLALKMKKGAFAVFHSNDLMPRNGDCSYNFRQNSDFFYLTGIDQEESILLLFPDATKKEDKEILFVKETNDHIKVWEGEKLSFYQAKVISGIENIQAIDDFESVIKRVVKSTKVFYYNSNENERSNNKVQTRDERLRKTIELFISNQTQLSIAPLLKTLRVIKSKHEVDLIKKACGITGKAFDRVLGFVKPGVWEFEIEAEISHEFTNNRAGAHAYSPIVAGGANSCILHYIDNNQQCKSGDVLLLDFGAEYANYASDLSRTIPISGKFSKRQKAVYDSCYEVFLFAKNTLKPELDLKRYQKAVVEEMEKQLIGLGLFTLSDLKKQDPEQPLYRNYFMHGTSHFMGLDVHDVGDRDKKLQPGMVLTCEPGIYIKEEGVGVRIENDILLTNNGNIDLMSDIPIESAHIEELMNK